MWTRDPHGSWVCDVIEPRSRQDSPAGVGDPGADGAQAVDTNASGTIASANETAPAERRSAEVLRTRKRIGLVAHDHRKDDLAEWAIHNRGSLARHDLVATATTGSLLEERLGLPLTKLHSGPLGGDLQLGALIAESDIDLLVFFWDPLEPQPHDPDIKALLRIAVVWNIPVACNRATADFLITSPLMTSDYVRAVPDHERRPERGA